MAMMTVRNIPDEVHRALRVRAALHGRSTEAEVRAILEDYVKSEGRIKLGSLLAAMGRQAKLTDEEFAGIEQVRDKSPTKPVANARNHGLAIGTADGYIAATAAANGMIVAARDTSPFQAAGVDVINPWED